MLQILYPFCQPLDEILFKVLILLSHTRLEDLCSFKTPFSWFLLLLCSGQQQGNTSLHSTNHCTGRRCRAKQVGLSSQSNKIALCVRSHLAHGEGLSHPIKMEQFLPSNEGGTFLSGNFFSFLNWQLFPIKFSHHPFPMNQEDKFSQVVLD